MNKFSGFRGWKYVNLPPNKTIALSMGTLAFATIIPAVFETKDLFSLFFSHSKIEAKPKWYGFLFRKHFLTFLVFLGIVFMILPFIMKSPWIWAFVWTGFILLIDPILYLNKDKRSILSLIERGEWASLLSIFLAGYVCGFLREFWNYWAHSKWIYTIPILEKYKIFEIPVIGFLAYGPFAFELYDFYLLVRFVKWKLSYSLLKRAAELELLKGLIRREV